MSFSAVQMARFAIKLASIMVDLSKDSPLKKVAKKEFATALYVLRDVNEESNIREGLNRALTHLESAYVNYLPNITTWDIWDPYMALHSKRTFANTLCLHISIIHYVLGNLSLSKKWLFRNLDTDGGIYFPTNILPVLTIQNEKSFYQEVCGTDSHILESMIFSSEIKYESHCRRYDPDEWGGYGPGCGGLYSG